MNETPCEEHVVATRFSLHKAGKRRASEVVLMVHFDKEVVAKIKKTIAAEVSNLLHIRPMAPLGLYVDGGFSHHVVVVVLLCLQKNIIFSESKLLLGLQKCLCRVWLTILRIVELQEECFMYI